MPFGPNKNLNALTAILQIPIRIRCELQYFTNSTLLRPRGIIVHENDNTKYSGQERIWAMQNFLFKNNNQ